jgi:hypothetical protein
MAQSGGLRGRLCCVCANRRAQGFSLCQLTLASRCSAFAADWTRSERPGAARYRSRVSLFQARSFSDLDISPAEGIISDFGGAFFARRIGVTNPGRTHTRFDGDALCRLRIAFSLNSRSPLFLPLPSSRPRMARRGGKRPFQNRRCHIPIASCRTGQRFPRA